MFWLASYMVAAKDVSLNANYLTNCLFRNFHAKAEDTLSIRNHLNMVSLTFDKSTIYRIPRLAFSTGQLKNLTAPGAGIDLIERSTFTNARSLFALNLTQNALEEIKNATFELAPKLNRIDLSFNRINKIESDAFLGLEALMFLSISHNVIEELNVDTFKPLAQLEILYLDQNKLKTLDSDTFAHNLKLRTFYVEHNQLTDFPASILDKQKDVLEHFDISDNTIEFPVRGLTKLEDIRVSNVGVGALEVFPSISVIVADHCQISEVIGSNLDSLTYAKLSHNYITNLSWLVNATRLYSLHLSHNRIETIGKAFNTLTSLKYLYLDSVGLKTIGYSDLSFQKNLKTLDIGYNGIGDFDIDKLVSLNSLETLYLDGNNMKSINIEEIILIFPKLKTLGLSNNNMTCELVALCVKILNKHEIALHADVERNLGNRSTLAGMACRESSMYDELFSPDHSLENVESAEISNDTSRAVDEDDDAMVVEKSMNNFLENFKLYMNTDEMSIDIKKRDPSKAAARVSDSEDDIMSRLRSIATSVNMTTMILVLAVLAALGYAGFLVVQHYFSKTPVGYPVQYCSSTNLIGQVA